MKHWDREKDEDCDENTKVSPFIPWVRANNEDEAKSKVFLQKLVEEFYCKAEKMKKEVCTYACLQHKLILARFGMNNTPFFFFRL